MRRATALSVLLTFAAATGASAEAWTPFSGDPAALQWFYDADYSYRDQQSGKVVVMQAVSKPSAKIGPSGPGKPDRPPVHRGRVGAAQPLAHAAAGPHRLC